MPGDLRQVPRVALTPAVQLRAELAHNFTDSNLVTTEEARGVQHSQRLRDRTRAGLQSFKTSGGRTTSLGDPKTARATSSPNFHTRTGEKLRNSRAPTGQELGG